MKPFAILAPRRETADATWWVGIHNGEPRLMTGVGEALQFARAQDAQVFARTYLDPGYEWTVTDNFLTPGVPGGAFTPAASECQLAS